MRSMGLFGLSAFIASAVILVVAYVLIPEKAWTNEAIAAIVIFALTGALFFYVPSVLVRESSGNDAARMASIGPLGVITGGTLITTAIAFVLAILGLSKLALALDIVSVGAFFIGILMLRAASNVIDQVATKYSTPSNHLKWQSEVQAIRGLASDKKAQKDLDQLSEKLRYSASDLPGGTPSDDDVQATLTQIEDAISTDGAADISSLVAAVNRHLSKREVFLRSARSKA